MTRKMMTKEVTFTTCKVAEMQVVEGKPQVVELDSERFMGNLSEQKLVKEISKMLGKTITVYDIQTETNTYEMAVEDFIKHAKIKKDDESE